MNKLKLPYIFLSRLAKTSAQVNEPASMAAFQTNKICRWMEACIGETLPQTTELEEGLRNGVVLAKLAHFMSPNSVPLKRIYDRDETRFNVSAHGVGFLSSAQEDWGSLICTVVW